MRSRLLFALPLCLGIIATSAAQAPKKTSRIKQIAGKALDSAATTAASVAADSLLGSHGKSLQGMLGTGELAGVSCPEGTMAFAAGSLPAGVGQPALYNASAGQAIVAATKKKLAGKPADTTARPSGAASKVVCATREQVALGAGTPGGTASSAGMDAQAAAAQAAAMGQGTPGTPNVGKMVMMATPAGAVIAAAPLAGKGAKALGGLLGRGQSKESMIKDLAKGRLVLKGVNFIAGSDALEDGFEDDVTALAEALQAIEGSYLLNIAAEVDGDNPADTVIARRRLQKLWAHLLVAGIQEPRLRALGVYPVGLDPKKKPPKLGDAKVEIIRLPADFKP